MKKLKTHRYLLVTVMGLLVACTSYTSTDEWANPRPNSNPDPEPVIGEITSIQSLNKSENVAVNSHADRKSTRLNSSHTQKSRMPSSA